MSMTLKRAFYKRLSIIVIVSVCLLSFFVIRIERMILTNDLRDKGESIARILSYVTLDAVLAHDYATVERYLHDVEQERFVVAAAIIRSDGEILAGSTLTGADDTFTVEYPVMLGSEDFAKVRIIFSTERINYILRTIILAAIFTVVLVHIAGIWVTDIVLNKAVINPLDRLNAAIQTLKSGDLQERITIEGPREFSEIAKSFNEMAVRIQESFHEVAKSHESLNMERAKLSAVVENVADGLFVTDRTGAVLSFNKSAERITGFLEDEVIGRQCEGIFRTSFCKDVCAIHHPSGIVTNVETELIARDGRKLAVSVSSAALRDADGSIIGGVQTFRDVTQDKRRQELFCHAEKLAAVGQLAAGVAHEINNPLGNILGFAKLIGQEDLPDNVNRCVEIIVEQTKKCSTIVKGLLDYSRSSVSVPSEVDLNSVVTNVVAVLEYQARKKNIAIHSSLSLLPLIYVDCRKIEQIVLNLLLNAIQAIDGKGNIHIQTRVDEAEISLAIKDDGPGIPEGIRSRIFDPFFTTKPVGEGTGLGLSICEGIVSELGGRIEVENRPREGAEFIVSFPINENNRR